MAGYVRAELSDPAEADLRAFYAARGNRPLWITSEGSLDASADALLNLVQSAHLDGVDPDAVNGWQLTRTIEEAREQGDPEALARAELVLSRSFAEYVQAMRKAPRTEMVYGEVGVQPRVPTLGEILTDAAKTPTIAGHLAGMGWMHPLYAPLRQAAASGERGETMRRALLANMERLRALPGDGGSRHILVDAASATLWMYDNGRPVDSMRVVVGKPDNPTPLIAGALRNAIFNPYWNVPVDLAQKNIAKNVMERGLGYLATGGYQVLSDWSDNAKVIDPNTVDWPAVARGDVQLRVRQLPGGGNAMGKVKYEFPNKIGIYLHDTPDKNLMLEEARQFSSGCIRLEDADRLGRWLMGSGLPTSIAGPEFAVDLAQPVPVYVTYLTAQVRDGTIALGPDPYGRDVGTLAGAPAVAVR